MVSQQHNSNNSHTQTHHMKTSPTNHTIITNHPRLFDAFCRSTARKAPGSDPSVPTRGCPPHPPDVQRSSHVSGSPGQCPTHQCVRCTPRPLGSGASGAAPNRPPYTVDQTKTHGSWVVHGRGPGQPCQSCLGFHEVKGCLSVQVDGTDGGILRTIIAEPLAEPTHRTPLVKTARIPRTARVTAKLEIRGAFF